MSFSMKKALEINRYALQGTMGTSAPPITVRKEQGAMLQVDYRLSPTAVEGSKDERRSWWIRECVHGTYPDAVGFRIQQDSFGFFLPGVPAATGTETAELAARLLPTLELPESHGVRGLSTELHFLAAPLLPPISTAFRSNEEIIHVDYRDSTSCPEVCQVQFHVEAGLPPGLDLRNIAAGLWCSIKDWTDKGPGTRSSRPFGFRVGRKAVVVFVPYSLGALEDGSLERQLSSLEWRIRDRIEYFCNSGSDRTSTEVVTSVTDHPQFCYTPLDLGF